MPPQIPPASPHRPRLAAGGFLRRVAAWASLILCTAALAGCAPPTINGYPGAPQQQVIVVAPEGGPLEAPPPVAHAPAGPAAIPPGGKVAIGVLLPLSGPSGALGHAMLDAAQMALFDMGGSQLQLIVRDTAGSPPAAAAAARSAIHQGARLLIGPLLAGEVEAVKPVARAANVPVVAFSTSTQLAGNGVYLLGFDPRQEIRRVITFAHARGLTHLAVLAPRSAYGNLAVQAAEDAVHADGGTLAHIATFDQGAPPSELGAAVQSLTADGTPVDALLLPMGGSELTVVGPLLPADKIDPTKVKLLGTGLWDEHGLGAQTVLDGGWYAAPAPAARAAFNQKFQALYHRPPPLLATLGYDATALAAVLARNPAGPDFSAAAMTNQSGFTGLDGIFRFQPNGRVQRGLAVLEVHPGGPTVLDPAPSSFQQLGF